jgi:hypothetical protein
VRARAKWTRDLGLDIAFDTHTRPEVQEIRAAIEGLRSGEITPSLRGISLTGNPG